MKPHCLFYTGQARAFHTGMKPAFYKFCGKVNTIFLTEPLFDEDEKEISDNDCYPVNQYKKENLFIKNWRLKRLAKKLVYKYKPKLIVATSDMHSLFEMYLMRYGKQIGAKNVAVQWSLIVGSTTMANWVDEMNAHQRFPQWIPFDVRMLLAGLRKYAGHFLYYWILPILAGEKPFLGRSSYILRVGCSGMRDSDIQTVFDNVFGMVFMMNGVPREKLAHFNPFEEKPKPFIDTKILTCIIPSENQGGIDRDTNGFIDSRARLNGWIDILLTIKDMANNWKIYISLHPETIGREVLIDMIQGLSKRFVFIDKSIPIENVITRSSVIVGFPPSFSTVLYKTSIEYPSKKIISLDPLGEKMGDYYKDFTGIRYIDNLEELKEELNKL